ncbi:MAG TPA: hypothetical protein VKB55_12165 [Nocardioidaceae bacterium]|nr:hypothetical protein [Nocardioidaceae bacterium]
MTELPPEAIAKLTTTPRWSALVRTGLDVDGILTWDPGLVRQSRVLVPIDVQALYVPPGDAEQYVRLPFVLTAPDGQPPEPMPSPFDPGAPRPAGVHLHWALPDAVLQGSLEDRRDSSNRLDLRPLPDRWVVLRLVVPGGSLSPQVSGWVLESDTARVVPLAEWDGQPATSPQLGCTVPADELDGTAGGSLVWTAGYDATVGRFAVHDPLDDLTPAGAIGDLATYLVAGWWSVPERDVLDGVQTTSSLQTRLTELGWSLSTDAEGGDEIDRSRTVTAIRREAFLTTADRYSAQLDGQSATRDASSISAEDRLASVAETAKAFTPSFSALADVGASVVASEPSWPRSTMLHGAVHGVPVAGPIVADGRPDAAELDVALGHHGDDIAATLTSAGLGAHTFEERRSLEHVLSAFTGQLLPSLGSPDGLVSVDEHEHASGFSALPGGEGDVERVTLGATAGPFDAGRSARSGAARNPAEASKDFERGDLDTTIEFTGRDRVSLLSTAQVRTAVHGWEPPDSSRPAGAEVREVRPPLPRLHRPLDPIVAVKGPRRSLRHGWDGRFSPDGRLVCRWPSQVPQGYEQLVDGARLLPSIGSGGVPPEVVTLAREALTQSPYLRGWLAEVARYQQGLDIEVATARINAEVLMRYGTTAVYDGSTSAFVSTVGQRNARSGEGSVPPGTGRLVADELRNFSLVKGVDASPVAVTPWQQPWIPMWLEWTAEGELADRHEGWTLAAVDLDPPADPTTEASPPTRTFTGRSPLHAGTATTLAHSIEAWAKSEDALDQHSQGEADEATEALLSGLASAVEYLDIVTGSLDGVREQLLGLPTDDGILRPRLEDGSLGKVAPVADPQLLMAGVVRLTAARLVDAFGRTLDLPVDRLRVPARDEVVPAVKPPPDDPPPDEPLVDTPPAAPGLRVRPRLTRPARWMFRFVDPAVTNPSLEPAEASIDQTDPAAMVNPVAGFLLPDHIDEALEVFDVAGSPLGQLMDAPVGGGVLWEIAPGREGPPDAGPLHGLDDAARLLGHFAAGMVQADARARSGKPLDASDQESGLSAFLRAVDSTLWTVDSYASLGSEHIAGLVGRPLAVVRARLSIEIDDDLDELDLSDDAIRAAREAAYRELADRAFAVRLGELTRSDDGLVAFFVDDDFTQVHVVDKVVRDGALASGPWEGHLGPFPDQTIVPDERPITHPYVVADDELTVHPGQVVTLTLLMHPAGNVNLTSGVLPRKALQLARDWVQPGLAVMAPSARIGPVLIDTLDVRLPKISAFGDKQIWTRRDTPSSWRDDPILAATQTALLPDLPHQVEEGYIRIAPATPEEAGGTP